MEAKSKSEFVNYINRLKIIGDGSQGTVFYDPKTSKVIKIFHDFFEDDEEYYYEIDEKELLKFNDCKNKTYIFIEEAILFKNKVIGYICPFIKGKNIDKINPLQIKLDYFIEAVEKVDEDIKIISDYGILTYDVLYNTMYGNKKINIIDPIEYCFSDLDYNELLRRNRYNFNTGIKLFLIDSYFNEFVEKNKTLNELYTEKDININEFLYYFKKYLNEYIGKNIETLNQANEARNKQKHKIKFVREYDIMQKTL